MKLIGFVCETDRALASIDYPTLKVASNLDRKSCGRLHELTRELPLKD